MMPNDHPHYPAGTVRRFVENLGHFALLLQDGTIVKHAPKDVAAFKRALLAQGAEAITPRQEEVIVNTTFRSQENE